MVKQTVKSCGVNYTIEVPTTAEEFDSLAGRVGACVEEANSNVIYRGTNADFRGEYLAALMAKYTYERPKTQDGDKKNEDGTPKLKFVNAEGKDIDLLIAANNVSEADQQAVADSVMTSVDKDGKPLVSFDPSERVRAPKADAIGKQDMETALSFLNGDEATLRKVLKNIKKQGGVEINLTDDKAANQLAIAKGIKAVRTNLAASLAA